MRSCVWIVAVAACLAGHAALAQQEGVTIRYPGQGGGGWSYPGASQPSADLTIEEQRKLGLSDAQMQKIAELRRDLEKQRVDLDAQLQAARQAASTANAEVARLQRELYTVYSVRLVKVLESVMTEDQLKAWRRQQAAEQAMQWLRGYRQWLNLTDAQVEDIAGLLAPVYEKYGKMEQDVADARDRLSELRRADKLDLAAIDQAEKTIAELSSQNIYMKRHNELMDTMRAGLMPDQLEKLDRMRGGKR